MWVLTIIIATFTSPAPSVQLDPVFPTNSRSWELTDALSQLHDGETTLERQVACMRLEKLGPVASDALRRAAIYDCSPEVRAQANSALVNLNPLTRDAFSASTEPAPAQPASSILADVRTSIHSWRGFRFVLARGRQALLDEALQMNINLLQHGNPGDRADAAFRLAHIRPMASPALPALVRALSDPNEHVRQAARDAIFVDANSFPVDLFLSLLSDPDPMVRRSAMNLMTQFAPEDPHFMQLMHPAPTRESLLTDLRSQSVERRLKTAIYISDSRLIPQPVAAALLRAVKSGDFVAREGLVLGIERAWANGGEIEAVLKKIQDDDINLTNRAFASAARRAITSIKPD